MVEAASVYWFSALTFRLSIEQACTTWVGMADMPRGRGFMGNGLRRASVVNPKWEPYLSLEFEIRQFGLVNLVIENDCVLLCKAKLV